jgi:DNA-binding NtrC family response regulator
VSPSLKEIGANAAEVAEKEVVWRMLEQTHWNRKESARRLRISYKALRNKLKKWKFTKPPSGKAYPLIRSA